MKRQKIRWNLWAIGLEETFGKTYNKSNNWRRMHGLGPRRGVYKKYHNKVQADVNRQRERRYCLRIGNDNVKD